MPKESYLNKARSSSFLEIVEKSIPTLFDEISIKRNDDMVEIDCFSKVSNKRLVKVKFTNFDIECECGEPASYNIDLMMLRFVELMSNIHGEKYLKDWEEYIDQKQNSSFKQE